MQYSDNGTLGVRTINWSNAVGTATTALITPPQAFVYQYDHKTSTSQVYLLDIQKQLGSNLSLETGYLGTLNRNLYGYRDANWAIPFGYIGNGAQTSIASRTHYQNYGVIAEVFDTGYGNYNAFSFKVTKRYRNGLNLIGSYTYAKSLDHSSEIRNQQSAVFPQNDLCIHCEYGGSAASLRDKTW